MSNTLWPTPVQRQNCTRRRRRWMRRRTRRRKRRSTHDKKNGEGQFVNNIGSILNQME
jgi:hypothetical protein